MGPRPHRKFTVTPIKYLLYQINWFEVIGVPPISQLHHFINRVPSVAPGGNLCSGLTNMSVTSTRHVLIRTTHCNTFSLVHFLLYIPAVLKAQDASASTAWPTRSADRVEYLEKDE